MIPVHPEPDSTVQEWTTQARKWHIDQVYRVHDQVTAEVIDGSICDIQSAGAVIAVYEALSPEFQDKAQRLGFARFGQFAWKHVS